MAKTTAPDATRLVLLRTQVQEGRRVATAPEVRAWGRDNGFDVKSGPGRLADALIDAFNAAGDKGRAKDKVQYVQERSTAPSTPRSYTYRPEGARKDRTFEALPAQIRAWAAENGIDVNPRGALPQSVVLAYGVAHEKPRAARKPRAPRKPAAQVEATTEGDSQE